MVTIIRFPDERRAAMNAITAEACAGSASVVILPVVRVERHVEEPPSGFVPGEGHPNGGRRRRRARPS